MPTEQTPRKILSIAFPSSQNMTLPWAIAAPNSHRFHSLTASRGTDPFTSTPGRMGTGQRSNTPISLMFPSFRSALGRSVNTLRNTSL